MARKPQETTRLMLMHQDKENMVLSKCGLPPIHDFTNKISNIFVLKVRKLDKEVIDVGREFQILGPW